MATGTNSQWTRWRVIDRAIPAPLPTISQILQSRDVFRASSTRKVVAIGHHFVAKYGTTVDTTEGDVLAFLEESTNIRTPKLYAVLKKTDPKTDETAVCIIMERIHGYPLKPLWPRLNQPLKAIVADQLKALFANIRAIPPPPSDRPYCNPMQGPLLDEMFRITPEVRNGGPFKSEIDLIAALINRAWWLTSMPKEYVDYLSMRLKSAVRPNSGPVFTHGHLAPGNVLLVPKVEMDGSWSGIEPIMVDWEFAGWYPAYWEFAQGMAVWDGDGDWGAWLDSIVEPFENHAIWIQDLMDAYWPGDEDDDGEDEDEEMDLTYEELGFNGLSAHNLQVQPPPALWAGDA
jgi:hypothetical protein